VLRGSKILIDKKGGDLVRKTVCKLKSLMHSKKAVSPVIAVILLIAIAVAASVTVFAYTQGIISGVTQANLVLANAEIVDSKHVKLTWSNTGGTSLEIDKMDLLDGSAEVNTGRITDAVTGELIDDDGGESPTTDLVIDAGTSRAIIMEREDSGTWVSGETITIQVWFDGSNTNGSPDMETSFQL
jgi:flagellin-like protein